MYSLRSLLLHTDNKEAARGTQTTHAYYHMSRAQDTTLRTFLTKDIDKFSSAVVIGLILIMLIVGTYTDHNTSSHSAYAHSGDSTQKTNDKEIDQYEDSIMTALNQVIAQENRQHILSNLLAMSSQEGTSASFVPINKVLSETSSASIKQEVKKIQEENKPVSVRPVTVDSAPVAVAESNKQYVVKEKMVVPMTAYSSTVDQTDSTPFITASNKRVRWGIVAANFLPFGTKMRIPSMYGDTIFTVEDRMNKRYWHRVDIWMHTRQEALQFGIRNLEIEILQEA